MKLSWNDRLSQMDRRGNDVWLDELTLSSFLMSVGALARQSYPEWLLHRFKAIYDIPDDYSLMGMLMYAKGLYDRDVNWDWEDEPEGPENYDDGFDLLYQLLIEPFYLIGLADQPEERGGMYHENTNAAQHYSGDQLRPVPSYASGGDAGKPGA